MLLTLGIILLICALFLIVAVLMQQGKGKSLGSAISGGSSDTYYGKTKGNDKDKKLSMATTVIAVVFVVLVLVVYIVQDSVTAPSFGEAITGEHDHDHASETETVDVDTTDATTTDAITEETTSAA